MRRKASWSWRPSRTRHQVIADQLVAKLTANGEPLTLTAYALGPTGYRLTDEFHGTAEVEACGTTVRLDLNALPHR
jgi:hypothetical protein